MNESKIIEKNIQKKIEKTKRNKVKKNDKKKKNKIITIIIFQLTFQMKIFLN